MDLIKRCMGFMGMVTLVFALGCASSGSASEQSSSGDSSSVEVNNSSITLADYLRKVAGISVQGSGDNTRVYVRGTNTAVGNNEPLFVVNGSRVGNSYQQVVSMIDVNDIDRVNVLKGSEAGSRYGLAGSGGVIEIETKD